MRTTLALLTGLLFAALDARAADPKPLDTPRATPVTRPDMKKMIEDMKGRTPRIPLPDLTAEDKAKLGDRADSYETRLRYHYLGVPADGRPGSGFSFGPTGDEATLDNTFKVQLFWIVSRTNNCQYCQGHQESKLLRAGQTEDQIAALDGDWNEFTEAQRVAFAFGRKFTYEPHRLNDADIDGLRKHYKDTQIVEMILSMAGNNAINRWKEGAGIPQSANGGGFGKDKEPKEPAKHSYLTPTSDKYKGVVSKVAPLAIDEKTGKPTTVTICRRPALESREEVEKALDAARTRTPRLPLAAEDKARELLPEGSAKDAAVSQFVRLLANFPAQGKARVASQIAADEKGDLKPLLKAQASWIIARQDRAWYATAEAKKRLLALGQTADQISKLDGDWKEFTETERALFTVAKKLGASPVVLTDEEVAAAVKLAGARDVVQMIQYVTTRASFDRITEAAGLQADK